MKLPYFVLNAISHRTPFVDMTYANRKNPEITETYWYYLKDGHADLVREYYKNINHNAYNLENPIFVSKGNDSWGTQHPIHLNIVMAMKLFKAMNK